MAKLAEEHNENWLALDHIISPSDTVGTHFPLKLNRLLGLNSNIDTLREWIFSFNATMLMKKKASLNESGNMSAEISKQLKDMTYLSVEQSRLTIILLVVTSLSLVLYVIWLTIKIRKTTLLTDSIILGSIPSTTATDMAQKVICQEPWVTYVKTAITTMKQPKSWQWIFQMNRSS